MRRRRALIFILALLLAAGGSRIHAHSLDLSALTFQFNRDRLEARMHLPAQEVARLLPDVNVRDHRAVTAYFNAHATEMLAVELDGRTVETKEILVESDAGFTEITLAFEIRGEPRTLGIDEKALLKLSENEQQLLTVLDEQGLRIAEDVLTPQKVRITVDLTKRLDALPADADLPLPEKGPVQNQNQRENSSRNQPAYFLLGIEHILTGYDHLLFLFGLLIVCDRFFTAAKIISLFTVAHTITLALAALNIVHLPIRIVEPAIAASITYVGIENILLGQRVKWRGVVTFCFGLIHGLGFASALQELGLGAHGEGILGPLFRFNIGVETGQLFVAALILPLIFAVRKRPAVVRWFTPACSVAVALLGGYWFVQRVFF